MAKELLRLSLPFYPERILQVLQITHDFKPTQNQILRSLEEGGWYTRMAQTYFHYCVYWGLIVKNNNNLYNLTPLGEATLLFENAKLFEFRNQLIYYSFASSKRFTALGVLAETLFNHLEKHGPFQFTNAEIPTRFVSQFNKRHDISDLTKVFYKVKIFKKIRKKGKLVYTVDYYNPKLGSLIVSLLHYIQENQMLPPHNIKGFDRFRAYWFMSMDNFIQHLRQGRAKGWVSYQEYADINQFQFNMKDILEMTEQIVR